MMFFYGNFTNFLAENKCTCNLGEYKRFGKSNLNFGTPSGECIFRMVLGVVSFHPTKYSQCLTYNDAKNFEF